ncbi:hypothetical protein FPOAC2_03817 [Fusarium poae]
MVLYPDNVHRVQRVKDLANDIATYQDEIKSQNTAQKNKDQRAYDTLASIAKRKGYSTPEEYVEKAIAALPEKEREKYDKLRKEITKTGEDGKMVLFVTGAVATLGMVGGAALGEKGLKTMSAISSWLTGFRATAQTIELELAGAEVASEALESLLDISKESFYFNLAEGGAKASTIAAEGVEEVSTLVKVGRFASRALVVLAILATIGGLVYEGIEGKKQMKKCQEYTLDLASKRFMVRKLKDNVEAAFSFMDNIYGLLHFEDFVMEDEDIPEDKKQAKIAKKIKETSDKFAKVPVPADDAVYGALRLKDEAANSWLDEDPKMAAIKAHLEELKKKEKK